MDYETLDFFTRLSSPIVSDDWKKSLNAMFILLRRKFVFDNLAIYLVEGAGSTPEVVYARAAGRGRNKEAEASWGEEIANQVISTGKVTESTPVKKRSIDRTTMPYLLGLPLILHERRGALVFVRFGGPKFTSVQMPLATLAATHTANALEQNILRENLTQLEHARHRAQLQDDFIATISHELHTPLGFIKGYTTSLLRSDTTWDSATQQEFLAIIDEESDHLLTLIDHMLDSARLQSGNMSMDFQPVRLDSLLRDMAQRIHGRHEGLEVILDLPPSPPIQADTVRLSQVFDNLFDNAIKYAPGSKITISLQVKDNWRIITFTDLGPGIPSEHIPFLFERFYRVPGQYSKSGTGLGLFICKQIVHAHHGRISVKTAPGKGTAFCIELPVRPENVE
ncbi:MAG: GAF domain-containing sensor histidine kinase [Anaerolineales bacterium]|jgi:signal transduction histidine kinase